jgi:hypothetical protein
LTNTNLFRKFRLPNQNPGLMKKLFIIIIMIAFCGLNEASAQWNTNGTHIYNTNSGFVGIGNNAPTTLLHAARNMTEPAITVQNMGGTGGATFRMLDNTSGADWKFKATNAGGFKIRDNTNGLDVITIESGSFINAMVIKSTDNIGIGTASPENSAVLDIQSNNKGFLLPRLTQTQISAISGPADGLQVYNTTDGKLYIFVAISNQWKEVAFGTGIIAPP